MLQEEAKNSLILGLSYNFRTEPRGCLHQAALFDDNRFVGALVASVYLTNQNLVPSPVAQSEHAQQLLSSVNSSNVKINSVVGECSTANLYREIFHREGKTTKTYVSQGIYRCLNVRPPSMSKGLKFRLADDHDIETIGQWTESFYHEAIPHDPPVNGQSIARSKIGSKMIYVVEQDGKLLSMAAWSRDIGTSCSINMVFTPKELRGNGYGSAVTGLLTQFLLERGKRETNLYTDLANPTSNKIYQNLGYEFVCNSVHFGVF